MYKEEEKQFRKNSKNSLSTQIMCPSEITQLSYPDEDGAWCSIAFMAYLNNHLDRLDYLMKEFDIEKAKGRQRLKETWLNEIPSKPINEIRKARANVESALSELVVADYLKKEGNKICDLEIKSNNGPDITSNKGGTVTYIEVKYLGLLPEMEELVTRKIQGKNAEPFCFDENRCAHYIYSRIIEGVIQLLKYNAYNRKIWLIFSCHNNEWRSRFEKCYFDTTFKWDNKYSTFFRDDLKYSKGRLTRLFSKEPMEWLKAIDSVVIATMQKCTLHDIKAHKF